MITLFRIIRLWQLKTKWKLAAWQLIDRQAMELIQNPEEMEKRILPYLAELIHKTGQTQGR